MVPHERHAVAVECEECEATEEMFSVAVAEFAIILVFLLTFGHLRRGRLVIFVTGSNNALEWCRMSITRSATLRSMQRLLVMTAMHYGITIYCIYTQSFGNPLPDASSRLHETGQAERLKYLLHEATPWSSRPRSRRVIEFGGEGTLGSHPLLMHCACS